MLLLGLAVGGSAVGLAYWGRRGGRLPRVLLGLEHVVVGLALGLPGTVLFIMWAFTDHTVAYRNENILLANPLTLVVVPLGIALAWGSEKARARLLGVWRVLAASGMLGLVLKVIPVFNQDNWRLIALILPISMGFEGAFQLDRLLARASTRGRAPEPQPLPPSVKTP
jgi:hypothetical protein